MSSRIELRQNIFRNVVHCVLKRQQLKLSNAKWEDKCSISYGKTRERKTFECDVKYEKRNSLFSLCGKKSEEGSDIVKRDVDGQLIEEKFC